MELSNLPKEIQIQICEFNTEHRMIFGKVLTDMPSHAWNVRVLRARNDETFKLLVKDEGTVMFDVFSKCLCCSRHKLKKPVLLIAPEDYHPEVLSSGPKTHDCKCHCRQSNRYICMVRFPEVQ